MAWEMNLILVKKLGEDPNISRLPFDLVCCTLRALVALAERTVNSSIPKEDVPHVMQALMRFEERWKLGSRNNFSLFFIFICDTHTDKVVGSYKERIEVLLGRFSCPGALMGLRGGNQV
jgi:hypothetical protein